MSVPPVVCLYCDGDGNSSAGGPCGFCVEGKPLDTQEDWDRSWGRVFAEAERIRRIDEAHAARPPLGFTEAEMVLLRRYRMDPIFHAKVVTYQHVHGDFSGKVTLEVLNKVARLAMAWLTLRPKEIDGSHGFQPGAALEEKVSHQHRIESSRCSSVDIEGCDRCERTEGHDLPHRSGRIEWTVDGTEFDQALAFLFQNIPSWENEWDQPQVVCVTHKRFIPCRPCMYGEPAAVPYSSNPMDVRLVADWQNRGYIDGDVTPYLSDEPLPDEVVESVKQMPIIKILPTARLAHEPEAEQPAEYPPCPCGKPSLAAMVEHICDHCADSYQFCYRCANPEGST